MNIPTMLLPINICPKVWEDIKFLRKKTHSKELEAAFPEEEQNNDEERINSIPVLKVITTYIIQTNNTTFDRSVKYDRQPFLTQGWTIFKLRYAFDNKGSSSGFRIIYCRNGNNFLLVYLNLKTYCANERALEKELMKRISAYLYPF